MALTRGVYESVVSGQTTNATPLIIGTGIFLIDPSMAMIEVHIMASNGTTGYSTILGKYYRDSGSSGLDGSVTSTSRGTGYTTPSLVYSGSHEIGVQVNGGAATTIDWEIFFTAMVK